MDNLRKKLTEALVPGAVVEFEPDEAEQVGAFADEAIAIEDACTSAPDLLDAAP
jgi:hypothetical protein